MKKIFVIFACLLILICLFDFVIVRNQYQFGYNASIIDKMERLRSIKEPKIVLIGDSNVAFGFRSELIEKEFNMPVVNLGLHGGLGNAFHENMIRGNVGDGDIIVLCHLNYNDNGHIYDYETAWETIEHHYDLWKIVPKADKLGIWIGFPLYLFDSIKFWITRSGNQDSADCYSRNAFNKYGDNVYASTHKEPDYFITDRGNSPYVNTTCANRINKLNKYVISKGATLVIAGSPIIVDKKMSDTSAFDKFQMELEDKMECPVISKVNDYFFDDSLFYNSVIQLNEEGAILRTNQLIKDLHHYLDATFQLPKGECL